MSAHSWRRLLLGGAVACIGLFVAWLLLPLLGDAMPNFAKWGVVGTPIALVRTDDAQTVIANNAAFLGLLLLTQWAFLRPVRRGALRGDGSVRPRWHAVAAVAFVAMLLCTALVATVLEMPDWWRGTLEADNGLGPMVWYAMLATWAAWFLVFLVYFRKGDFLARAEVVVRTLIRGSCLELCVAIPTHAFVYRRHGDDCYCVRGSYTGLVLGTAVLLWAFGPGLVLLFWREKQRREPILQRLCPQCGATLDPAAAAGAPCPQCGRVATAAHI